MPLTIEIVTPERKTYTGTADGVTLPTKAGEINILPGHIPLTTMIEPGEIVLTRSAGGTEKFVTDRGFARVLGDTVSILTEAAIDENEINFEAVAEAEKRAQAALTAARENKEIDSAEIEKMEQILRFAAVQRLIRKPGK